MPFINEITKYKSLSIVGLEKNTGKTECLNYVLRHLEGSGKRLALTSIGVDGEKIDQATLTSKPEIELYEDVIFITSEIHYKQRRLTSEILEISDRSTSLGRLVTARSITRGKVMFSGPSNTLWLKSMIDGMTIYNVDTTIVDGALSRLSLGSPAVTESMILNTGAAVSANMSKLVSHTRFVYELIKIPAYISNISDKLLSLDQGIWAIDEQGNVQDLEIPSVFLLKGNEDKLFQHGSTIYITGALSDKMLDFFRIQKNFQNVEVIVRDFTRLFVKPETYRAFINSGGRIKVLLRTTLLAICVNPTSPQGYILNSKELCASLSEALKIPVYDLKKL